MNKKPRRTLPPYRKQTDGSGFTSMSEGVTLPTENTHIRGSIQVTTSLTEKTSPWCLLHLSKPAPLAKSNRTVAFSPLDLRAPPFPRPPVVAPPPPSGSPRAPPLAPSLALDSSPSPLTPTTCKLLVRWSWRRNNRPKVTEIAPGGGTRMGGLEGQTVNTPSGGGGGGGGCVPWSSRRNTVQSLQ